MWRLPRVASLFLPRLALVTLLAAAGNAAVGSGFTAAAQQAAAAGRAHPVSGRVYALPMGVQGEPWLWREERQDEEEPDLALRLLKIKKGSSVADIGAGSGYMTIRLAKIVGAEGMVYANDLQQGMLDLLQVNLGKAKVKNVTPILGTYDDPRLPPASVDLVLMVDVYHEFSEPQKMLQRLREAMKPDARLVLLEYRAEDPAVPILPAHKMTVAQARLEVEHEGFKLADVKEDLPRQHILIFQKAAPVR
jgi:precorrin-6B methylase 2